MRLRNANRICPLFIFLALAACSATNENSATTEITQAADEQLLAELSLADGRQLKFYEHSSGVLSVAESGPAAKRGTPVLSADSVKGSLAEVYARFAPAGGEVPRALVAADARSAKAAQRELLARGVNETHPPPFAGPSAGSGPALYSDADQAWFRSTFCPPARQCIQTWGSARSNWDYARVWGSTGYVNPGGATSLLGNVRLNSNGTTGVLSLDSVAGGTYVTRIFVWRPNTFFLAALSGAGNFQVSLATYASTPSIWVDFYKSLPPNEGFRRTAFSPKGAVWNGDGIVKLSVCGLDNRTTCHDTMHVGVVTATGEWGINEVIFDCRGINSRSANLNAYLRGTGSPSGDVAIWPSNIVFNCI